VLDRPALDRRLGDVAFRRPRVTGRGGKLSTIGHGTTPTRTVIGRRLRAVAHSRLLVTIRSSVLTTISSPTTQSRALVGRRLSPITLSRSRLTQLSCVLPIYGGTTTVPPALIELRRLRIRFDARPALVANRRSIVAVAVRAVRSSARVFVSLGQLSLRPNRLPGISTALSSAQTSKRQRQTPLPWRSTESRLRRRF
jgi:hypothetical protein